MLPISYPRFHFVLDNAGNHEYKEAMSLLNWIKKSFAVRDNSAAAILSSMGDPDEAAQRKAFTFIERLSGVPVHKFRDFRSYIEAGTGKVWAVFRSCHLVANVLVSTTFNVIGPDGKVVVRLPPDLKRIMTKPNPYQSWEELIYLWGHHIKLTGNCFWLKDEMNGFGQPKYIYPLMPQYMEVVPDENTKVKEYRYRVNGQIIIFAPRNIIHFQRPNPNGSLLGIGDIEAGAPLFQTAVNQSTYDEKFLENGASPSGVLIRKQVEVDKDEWKKMKVYWDVEYAGKNNIGKTAFLNGDWTYQQLGLTARDMQSIEKSTQTTKDCFLAMGIPLSVAGIEKAANYATAKQDDINFRKYECVPHIDLLVGKLNDEGGLIRSFDDNFRLDYSLAGLIDVEQVVKEYKPLVESGAMTLNEFRVMCGLPKTDNPLHDEYYVTGQITPLEMAGLADPPVDELAKIAAHLTGGKKRK